jgi:uncharacterized protein
MKKLSLKSWAWLPLALVAAGLLLTLIFIVARHDTNPEVKQSEASQQAQAQNDARDGKTEQITLVSQKGSYPVMVEIASTDASQARGLSGRDGLAANTGMLFVFSKPGYDCFWMKDMKFDIDMLWFDQTQSLVHVQENAGKATYPNSFCPPTSASYVLELPAGTVSQLGLKLGDRFTTP